MLENLLRNANCKGRDTNLFFEQGTKEAKLICRKCTVREECRDYAVKHFIDFGVWGGMSHHELRAYRRKMLGDKSYAPKRNWVIR